MARKPQLGLDNVLVLLDQQESCDKYMKAVPDAGMSSSARSFRIHLAIAACQRSEVPCLVHTFLAAPGKVCLMHLDACPGSFHTPVSLTVWTLHSTRPAQDLS